MEPQTNTWPSCAARIKGIRLFQYHPRYVGSRPRLGILVQVAILRTSLLEETAINPIIVAELASRFKNRTNLDHALDSFQLILLPIPREAAFQAGKAFVEYRKREGTKTGVLPNFFIGAHAEAVGATLLTRDIARYKTDFPSIRLMTT